MDNNVQSHELPEVSILEAEHVSVVGTVIEASIGLRDLGVISIAVVINNGSNAAHLGAKIKSILESRLPVFSLVNAILVGLRELGSRLAHERARRQLRHRMHSLRERSNELLLLSGQLTTAEHVFLEFCDFRVAREFTREQKPQDTLRDGLTAGNSLGSLLSDREEIHASVSNTLGGMQLGRLIEHTRHASHATDNLRHRDLTHAGLAEFLVELTHLNLSLGNHVLHLTLEGGGKVSLLRVL